MQKSIKHLHFIGIGGSGMNGIAEVFLNLGYKITGSDIKESENTKRIEKSGGKIFIGHDAKNIKGADIVVYSNAIPETNPEIVEARKQKIPVVPRAVMLDEIMRLKYGIAIAGSHGKTTTTWLLASIFEEAKLDPTYIVGGIVRAKGAHAKAGKGKYVIAEACEAFGSFLKLNPVVVGVTNIDNDHMDYYKRMDALKEAFVQFINNIPFYGVAYLNGDDPNIRSIQSEIFVRVVFYGFDKTNDIYAENIKTTLLTQSFDVVYRNKKLGKFVLGIPGKHNVHNSLMAIAIAYDTGIKLGVIKRALKKFKNVKRRFNIFKQKNYTIIDDYAHHPMEIRKVLETGKEIAKNKIIVIFQPHLYSRTQLLYKEFASSLSIADVVILDNIYPAREAPIPGVSSALIKDSMLENGFKNVYYETNWEMIIERLKRVIDKNDIVFILGAGNIYEIRKEIEKCVK
ncbi:MAG: UDP-N-acetylmuramate--L-alanine ligase [Candidatus Goldbacteria bacterium]|nr:UDP-N-acetylmuramate--L-alanine ligase [Candidatus Goldiibacteriota bacterium]